MKLTLVDCILLAAPLVILYAIFVTLQSMEEEWDNPSKHSNGPYQKDNGRQSIKGDEGKYMHDRYMTIPNMLSVLRMILLIPILLCFYS